MMKVEKLIVILLQLIIRSMYRVTYLLTLFLSIISMMLNMLLTASEEATLQRMKVTQSTRAATLIHVIALARELTMDLITQHVIQVNFLIYAVK